MLSVIGIGGAGGNIADEFAKHDYLTGAINYSQKDLQSLESVRYKIRLNGSDGVGHDRKKAIELFTEQHQNVINFIKDNFADQSNEMIIFPFACGGGSGSGLAPILIDLVSNILEDKVIVAMPILPSLSESAVSQLNAVKVFEELSSLDVCILPLDNEQLRIKYGDEGKGKMIQKGNENVVKLFNKIMSYTENSSKSGNFDKRDFLTIFNTKGIGMISETDIVKIKNNEGLAINKQGISNSIQKSWKQSIFTPIGYYKILKSAVIFDAQEELLEFLDFDHVFQPFECGLPVDIFEGVYHDKQGDIVTILTGLPWCKTRLNQIESIIDEKQVLIEKALSEEQEYKSKSFDLVLQAKEKPKAKRSFQDILKKYK